MEKFLELFLNTGFWFSVIRVTTPILFPAIASLITDKAGIMNISMEGTMLISALTGVLVSAQSGSAWIGLLGAMGSGLLISFILAFFTLELKTDVILGGTAVNLFADGGTIFILYLVTGDKGTSVSLQSHTLPTIDIPLIQNIPILGNIISGHNILTYTALIIVFVVYYLIAKTPLGLQLKSVGENYKAAQSVGINVKKIRYIALLLSGLIASLGGAYMSMAYLSNFTKNMVAGRGWIALAAEAMGHGNVIATALTALLFGFSDATANRLQMFNMPAELVGTIPYVATLFGLILYARQRQTKQKQLKAL
ncbi:MAG: ABC transporter permease [Spirochaetales bacterium]